MKGFIAKCIFALISGGRQIIHCRDWSLLSSQQCKGFCRKLTLKFTYWWLQIKELSRLLSDLHEICKRNTCLRKWQSSVIIRQIFFDFLLNKLIINHHLEKHSGRLFLTFASLDYIAKIVRAGFLKYTVSDFKHSQFSNNKSPYLKLTICNWLKWRELCSQLAT